MKIEILFSDERINDEDGWWEVDKILVKKQDDKTYELGVLVHEVVEWYLENILKFEHEKAHRIAEEIENDVKNILKGDGNDT